MAQRGRSASGYAAWRLIAEELRGEILAGTAPAGARLPSEGELAERFAVNRHTVRQAVATLAAENLVVARRGSGTFVAEHDVVVHRIGVRTRLSDSLRQRGLTASGRLVESVVDQRPPAEVVERLQLGERAARRLEVVRSVKGQPISRVTNWLDAARFPRIAEEYAALGSMTAALAAAGVEDYVRAATTVSARVASSAESQELDVPQGSVLLVVRALDVLPAGAPLVFNTTRFPASRVELDVEHTTADPATAPAAERAALAQG